MRDVGERACVRQYRSIFAGLSQVGPEARCEKSGHGAGGSDVLRSDGSASAVFADHDPGNSPSQVFERTAQRKDRHDFRSRGNLESGFSVCAPDFSETSVGYIDCAFPGDYFYSGRIFAH